MSQTLLKRLRMLTTTVLDFIFPSTCRACMYPIPSVDAVLCHACDNALVPIAPCELPLSKTLVLTIHAATAYDGRIKGLLGRKFFSDLLASQQLAYIIARHIDFAHLGVDYLVPIPLHITRYASRGFNQAAVIAKILSKKHSCSIASILRRSRRTHFQSHLPLADRHDNVRDVFTFACNVHPHDYQGKHLVLVDDVATTGATLLSAACVLQRCKPRKISAIVAARARM